MLFTTKWLSECFLNFRGDAQDNIAIDVVTTDSRQKVKKALFIPIIGEKFDGHNYVKQALDNGSVAVLWDKNIALPGFIPTNFPVFYVDNTLTSLQILAAKYRNEVNPIVIGITGSNGKTTTKDLVAAMVKTKYKTHYTDGNFNNHIGLPLTVLSMGKETEVLILEMGMSDFGEIDLLSKIARPDYAIITNIGESHIEFLGSRQGIAKAKLEIINGLKDNGTVIIDGDEELLNSIRRHSNTITCGFNKDNDVMIDHTDVNLTETTFRLSDGTTYAIPLSGKHHAKNATFAITLGEQIGIEKENRKQALLSLKHTSMRFELICGLNGVSIINDAYNASPTSMKAAIEVVKQLDGFTEKVLILGDVLELGSHSKAMHRSVADCIESPITAVFTLGTEAEAIASAVKEMHPLIRTGHFTAREELIQALQPYLNKASLLLFKASRGLKFESLIENVQKITK